MTFDLDRIPPEVVAFLTERHLATLTTVGPSGDLQVTPVGVTFDPTTRMARVISWTGSIKYRNLRRVPDQRVGICQVDGGRWLSLYGAAEVSVDPDRVAAAVEAYARRYRQPKERADRVVIEVMVDRMVGRA